MECVATLSRQERLAHKVGFAQKLGGEPNGGFWGGQCTTRLRTSTYHTGAHAKNHIFNFLPARCDTYIYIYIYWLRFFKQSMFRKVKLYGRKFSGFRSPPMYDAPAHFKWSQIGALCTLWLNTSVCLYFFNVNPINLLFPFFLSLSLLPPIFATMHLSCSPSVGTLPNSFASWPGLLHLTDENRKLIVAQFSKKKINPTEWIKLLC